MIMKGKYNVSGILSKIILFIIIIFFIGAKSISGFVLDYRWFEYMGYAQVFTVTFTAKAALFLAGAAVYFLIFLSLWQWCKKTIAGESGVLNPYWEHFGGKPPEYIDITPQTPLKKVLDLVNTPVIAALLVVSFFGGLGLSAEWNTILLYFNRTPFGSIDPVFGKDIGFYIFSLPFFHTVLNYFTGLFILAALSLSIAYLVFNWRLIFENMPFNLRGVIAVLFFLIAVKMYLLRFDILYSTTGIVYGAGYVDVYIKQYIPVLISLVCLAAGIVVIAMPVVSERKLSIVTPMVFVFLALIISILAGGLAGVVQEFKVSPNEIALEEPFIRNNIDLTNEAYDLSGIREQEYPISYNLTAADLDSYSIRNIRLWDYRPLLTTFQQRQEIRTYYGFGNVVVDRYTINGELTQVWMSVREILPEKLKGAADTWINRHLIYTHGIGVVMSPVNDVDDQGLPKMIIKDVPPKTYAQGIKITQPRIYFGEKTGDYIITNTNREEFDYPMGDQNQYSTYEGTGGILLTPSNKLVSSMALGEVKLYTSEYITKDSKLHLYRNIYQRASKLTPYLVFDSDPHAFISSDGRIYWMLSGFVTSGRYPYSEPVRFGNKRFNYIRDSVKAVIDTYNGTTTYYIVKEDPILRAYAEIYPDVFKPFDEMPDDMRSHLRYSEDLFNIQTGIYTVYHMKSPEVFYNKEDRWEIPTEKYEASEVPVQPYNVLLQLNDTLSFVTMMPFTPVNRNNMISWVAVNQDPLDYGEITVFKFTKEEQIYGPSQIEARIDQDESISKDLTLWGQSGSRVIRGNLLVIPFKNSLLYIEPLYLAAETSSIPELKRVIVFYNNRVAMEPTLREALNKVLGVTSETAVQVPSASPGVPAKGAGDVNAILNQTLSHYEIAREALAKGDLETYGREMKTVDALMQQLKKQIEGE
ncbi:MAG: UPF0182 family protein [Candidatus Methanoperedenaceae archaeon HGW-Methanoperedenaceae-1]|jgi:hypothetical protein|nr:MAG: UPF0182 family protein [Candidatus Methanoperedenaceae archaeon HGW-Methanoperedenaceae-1]